MEQDTQMACDLLVVGTGMAGLTAASVAASRGAIVLAVDKEPTLGGSAAISGGHIWTTPTLEDLFRESPGSDPALARVLLERFGDAVDWIRESGAWVSAPLSVLGYGRGYRFDVLQYFDRCRAIVESAGGWVIPGRPVTELIVEQGAVVGGRIVDADGETLVRAPFTLLATGGFAASPALVEEHIGPAEHVLARCAAGVTGDGLTMALRTGAATTEPMSAFYGHLVAWPLTAFGVEEFIRLSFFSSNQGLLLDLDGQRFTDESHMDHRNAQAVAACRDGRAALVFDAGMTAAAVSTPAAEGMDRPDPFLEAIAGGANARECGSIDELGEVLGTWGFDGDQGARTLKAYDGAVIEGDVFSARRAKTPRFVDPPFRVAEVRAGVTVTEGGLVIGADGAVHRPDGSRMPGLLAAGADAGGTFDGGYAGGLAAAATQALTAADTVVTRLSKEAP